MAKNIDFMGAVFPDVPSVKLPQQGGGLVSFDDTTDATATADKILEGYTAYAGGEKLVGTASGGITPSGTYSITSNGIYDIVSFASVDVNVSGGGGSDHDVEDSLVTKTIHGVYENSRVERIGRYAFAAAALLSGVSIPNATFMDIGAFQGCSKLSFAYMPLIRSIQQSAFLSCLSLTSFYAPHVSYIGASAFINCSYLTSLYLLSTSVVSLGNRSVFNGTPMSTSIYARQWGSIYVPASLVDSYKSAANWSYYSNRITAYEG